MNNGIIVAGNMIVDVLKDIDVYPEHSKLTSIRRVNKAMGGLVCNCGLDLAKLDSDMPVKFVGAIGDDDYGKYIRERVADYPNIDMSHVQTLGQTSFTDAMCDTKNHTRTFFTFRGASSEMTPADFDFDKIKGDILHIGYILLLDGLDAEDNEYGTAMARVLADAQAHGIKTSIDVVSEEGDRFRKIVSPALKYTDYCVINETESEKVTGIKLTRDDGELDEKAMPEVFAALRELGVKEWIVIHSKNEAFGQDKDGNIYNAPSIDIPRDMIAGTTGAGDAFCSGILYGAYREMALPEAMKFANAVASSSLLTPGASDGILSYEDTVEYGRTTTEKYGLCKVSR